MAAMEDLFETMVHLSVVAGADDDVGRGRLRRPRNLLLMR